MLPIFKAATKTALSLIGEGCLLRGVAAQARLQYNVETQGENDEQVYRRTVAHLDKDDNPQPNDVLSTPDGVFVLEFPLKDDGPKVVYVVRPVTPYDTIPG